MTPVRRHRYHRLAAAAAAAASMLAAPAHAANYSWLTGNYSGTALPGGYAAGDTLQIGVGGYKYLDGSFSSAGHTVVQDNLYLENGNTITNSGLFDVQADIGFYDGGYSGALINTGNFAKSAGSGTTVLSGVNFTNNAGSINAQTGTINFALGTFNFNAGTQFFGGGQSIVTGGANFAGALTANNLSLAAGTFTGNASVVTGALNWTGGTLAGTWQVAAGQVLNAQGGGYKYFDGTLSNLGQVKVTDNLYFLNGNGVVNQGVFDLQADVGLNDGGYGGTFTNTGTLRKSAGSGTSYIAVNGSGFSNNGGTIDAQTGTINFNSGPLSFNNGSQFTGSGQTVVSSSASFNGTLTSSNLYLTGGTFTGAGAVLQGVLNWTGGTLAGDWKVAAAQTLNVQGGGYKYISGTLTNQGSVKVSDNLYFQNGNSLANQGLFDLQGDFSLGDGGYGGGFVNTGTLRKSAGSGTSYIGVNGSGFSNNGGTIEAQTGTINFNSGALSFSGGSTFTGAGQIVVSSDASFSGALTGSNLSLVSGTQTGSGAVIQGALNFSSGTLAGDWQVAAGQSLNVQGGGYKYLSGTLTNKGSINAADTLYLQNGNTLANQGLYLLQGDVGLSDGGYSGSFVNTGTLRKSAGSGVSYISGLGFTNNGGTIEALTGSINFNSGSLAFNDGTLFKGAGQVVVSGSASFSGSINSQNLVLSSAAFTGGGASPSATFTGATTLAGGSSLNGNIVFAAGHTLNVQSGGYKYINGTVTNNGVVNAADNLYLQNGNLVTNNGRYNLQGDVGISDGGYNGSFVNNGLMVKSAGTGTSDVSSIGFVNNGTVQVATGTLQLPANFSNAGTLTGTGAFVTSTLTNNGHMQPGSVGVTAGPLTLQGNYAQSALGFFDVDLHTTTDFGQLLVSGSASLAGGLDVNCVGACTFAAGTQLVVLQTTGSVTGSFAGPIVVTGFAAGAFTVSYTANQVLLNITQDTVAAVPEPQSWALMLGGLGLMVWVARQRRA